jgi:hypothetical protein
MVLDDVMPLAERRGVRERRLAAVLPCDLMVDFAP